MIKVRKDSADGGTKGTRHISGSNPEAGYSEYEYQCMSTSVCVGTKLLDIFSSTCLLTTLLTKPDWRLSELK